MLVSDAGFPDDIRIRKEAIFLSKKFYVQLIEWDRSGMKKKHEFFDQNIEIFRIRLKSSADNIHDFLIHLPIFWFLAFMLLLKLKVHVLHCHDFDTLPIGILAKFVSFKTKVIFDSHEHYPSMISQQAPKILQRIVSILFVSLPHLVNGTIVVNDYLAEFFKDCKTVIVMNVPPLTEVDKPVLQSVKTTNKTKNFTIFYFGALTKRRGIHLLMDLAEKMPNVKLLIAGEGAERESVLKRCMYCPNIDYLGWIPYQEICRCMLTADLIPILYSSDILNNKIATPNKLFLAMSYGKPVVVYNSTLTERIVKKEKMGFSINENNIEELAKVVETLTSDSSQFDVIRKNGQAAFYREYNWEIMEDRLIAFYESILGKV